MIVTALLAFLPLVLLHTFVTVLRKQPDDTYLQMCILVGLPLTLMLNLPDDNQYKGVYLLSILFAVSGLSALRYMLDLGVPFLRWLSGGTIAAFALLVLVKVAFVTQQYELKSHRYSFAYEGAHINYLGGVYDTDRVAALYWIRSHTTDDAVVVLPLHPFKFVHMMHERQAYVRLREDWFTDGIAAYDRRAAHLSQLYDPDTPVMNFRRTIVEMERELPGRLFYAVVKDSEVAPHIMLERGARFVYEDPNQQANVFLLNPHSSG